MAYDFYRITLLWNTYSPYKTGRKQNYFHTRTRAADEAVELLYTGFSMLTNLPLGEVRRSQSARFAWNGEEVPDGTILHNVGVFLFEMEDGTFETVALPAMRSAYFDERNFLVEPIPTDVENFIQLVINAYTPRPGGVIARFVGGYFGIAQQ